MSFKMKPGSKQKHSEDTFSISSPMKRFGTPNMSPLKQNGDGPVIGGEDDRLTKAYKAAEAAGTIETAPGVYTKWEGSDKTRGGHSVEDRAAKLANDPYSEKEAAGIRDYRSSVKDPRTAQKSYPQREGESGQDYYDRLKALSKTRNSSEARRAGLLRKKKK